MRNNEVYNNFIISSSKINTFTLHSNKNYRYLHASLLSLLRGLLSQILRLGTLSKNFHKPHYSYVREKNCLEQNYSHHVVV